MNRKKHRLTVCCLIFGALVLVSHLGVRKDEFASSLQQQSDQTNHARVFHEASITKISRITTQAPRSPSLKYEWEKYVGPMSVSDETTLRCKALDMGCFVGIIPNFQPAGMKINLRENQTDFKYPPSKEMCMDACFRRKYRLAGFVDRKEKSCYCSSSFSKFFSSGKITSAVAADSSSECRGTSYENIRLYSKLRDCGKGFSDLSLKLDRVGCVEVPSTLTGIKIALTQPNITVQQCILNCEARSFSYAIPVMGRDSCICSDSVSLFGSAEKMLKAMGACGRPASTVIPVYKTYVDDPACGPFRFLNKLQAPPTLLASYYGSGNTWIRHLIELATGIYTGSVYNDMNLYKEGMLGETLDEKDFGRVIAVKDHLFELKVSPVFQSAILLIRNPFDATLAEFERQKTHSHTGVIDKDVFKSPDFEEYMRYKPQYWYGLAETVLKSFKRVLVVYFEDLKLNPVKQLHRIVEFLPDQTRIAKGGEELERKLMCMNLDLVGKFKRKPRNLDYDPYSEMVRKTFNEKIRELNDLLLKYNQPQLPESYFTATHSYMSGL